ncbi:hypothetical protein RIF29_29209 [Crotalaria pallida]|uniref:Uncharacterized protein n=1 Tax=Crotalaria pallida TaxID=3830 RepID=A0AAN9HW22_CROPI
MIMPYNIGGGPLLAAAATASESDEQQEGGGVNVGVARGAVAQPQKGMKKRYRTKFSQEQKDKMLSFAEKVGWKIQKQEVVQQFCQEIGVKRRVLKLSKLHLNCFSFPSSDVSLLNIYARNRDSLFYLIVLAASVIPHSITKKLYETL